jgi:hypothetical protein
METCPHPDKKIETAAMENRADWNKEKILTTCMGHLAHNSVLLLRCPTKAAGLPRSSAGMNAGYFSSEALLTLIDCAVYCEPSKVATARTSVPTARRFLSSGGKEEKWIS